MSQTTTESRQRQSLLRSLSAFLTPKSKARRGTPQILPITHHTSASDERASSILSSYSSGSSLTGTFNARSDGPPSYAHAVSRSKPTSYRFVQESAFSMNLVTQEGPSNVAYNISIGVNVWMPSEHLIFVRRHANPESPVLARLE